MQTWRIALSAIIVLGACADDPLSSPIAPALRNADARPAGAARIRTLDDRLTELAEQLPGFGGLYYDDSGSPVVFLTDVSRAAAAQSPIRSFLESDLGRVRAAGAISRLRVIPGDYDFRQLAAWHRIIALELKVPGITMTDIDDSKNRLTIGVRDVAALSRVQQALANMPIPVDAVNVVLRPPAVMLATLGDAVRPMVSGLRVQAPGGCTYTANAWLRPTSTTVDSTRNYIITNSHCTSSFGAVTGDLIGQPNLSYVVGDESFDPALFDSSWNTYGQPCPVGRLCRFSDAAMFWQRDIPGDWDYWPNTSAETSSPGTTIYWYIEIIETAAGAPLNDPVFKVGATTGTTHGRVRERCASVPQYDSYGDTGRTMLCQDRADYNSGPGDSGSPVFWRSDPLNDPRVHIVGIHWGSGGWYSGWWYTEDELASAAGAVGLRVESGPWR
ncbi:MAG: hypothetical protein WED32_02140 [Patescibacteria group bacterium]